MLSCSSEEITTREWHPVETNSDNAPKNDIQLDDLIEEGIKHAKILHEYESVIPKLAKVKGDSDNKTELYQQNYDLLLPQIEKMRGVHQFYDKVVSAVVDYMVKLLKSPEAPTDKNLDDLTKILDIILILDYLKTWQAGLNNDFSMYRRAIQHVKKDYNMSEDESLRFFLVNSGNINKGLKKALQTQAEGYYKVLVYVIRRCIERFEKSDDDFQALRVIVFGIFLIDDVLANPETLTVIKKQFRFSKTSKLCKKYPRISLYKELPFNVVNYMKLCPNFNQHAESSGCAFL